MPLDPQLKAMLDSTAGFSLPDLTTLEPAVVRQMMEAGPARPEGEPVAKVRIHAVLRAGLCRNDHPEGEPWNLRELE